MKKTIKLVLQEALRGQPAKIKILEQDMPADMMAPEMESPAAGTDSGDQIKQAFRAMVMAAFDDDSLDTAATLARIKEILKAQEKLMGSSTPTPAAGDSTPSDAPADTAPTESRKGGNGNQEIQERLARMEKINQARDLCDAEGIVPTLVLKKALESAKDQNEMKILIAEHKSLVGSVGKQTGSKPRSAGAMPIQESLPEIKDQKTFAESCFSK